MKQKIIDVIAVLFGNFLLAVSVAYFVLPYDILSGGVAGIAVITKAVFNWSPTLVIDVLVISLFIVGAIFFGKEFALKTALSSIAYPIFVEILVRNPIAIEVDQLLSCVFGGVIAGVGMGIAFRHNASTGGTDILSLLANKYMGVSVSSGVMVTDSIITLMGLLTYGLQDVFLGIIYIYTASMAINRVVVPKTDEAIAVYVITSEFEKISDFIHYTLERGTTILAGRGGYTNEQKNIILTVVSKNQYVKLSNFIEKADPYAFVIVSDAKEIKGEGFSYDFRV